MAQAILISLRSGRRPLW